MTDRETQLFQWITEDPMISQEELAAKAGIKRSSVAVHISNLMKKGYIKGKGYITSEPNYYCVIGAANIDIGGVPDKLLIERDSNPGQVTMSLGGVGRNIACNLRMMGLDVKLISAIGDDMHAHRIIDSCNRIGVDVSHSLRSLSDATSTYIYISEKEGDMRLAIADMNIYQQLTPQFLESKIELLTRSRAIVMDTNIPQESIEYILNKSKVPVYVVPVSTVRAHKIRPFLNKIHTITANRLEAEVLSGVTIIDEASARQAASIILKKGVLQVFILLGEYGVLGANRGEMLLLPKLPTQPVNESGSSDAFVAGVVLASTRRMELRNTALLGLACSSIAVQSKEAVSPMMSIDEAAAKAGIKL